MEDYKIKLKAFSHKVFQKLSKKNYTDDYFNDFKASDTYKFRLKFKVSHKGIIQSDVQKYHFTLLEDKPSTLKGLDAKTLGDSTQFSIVSGGYETEDEAYKKGILIKRSVLSYGAKFRIGVDVGRDIRTGGFSRFMKDKIFNERGVKLIDDIHGVSVYSEKYPTMIGSVGATALINARPVDFFVDEISQLVSIADTFNPKILLAMELITASIFETTHRTRFLTLVLAVESILEIDERPEDVQELVEKIIEITGNSGVDHATKKSIIGSLKLLKKESTSRSLRKQSLRYLRDKEYGGLNSERFIKKCYEARSQLVHTGKVNEEKYNINTLAANLEMYLKDLISVLAGI